MDLPPILKLIIEKCDIKDYKSAIEIFNLLEQKSYRPKTPLLEIGDNSRYLYLIKSGIVKAYIKDDNGELQTVRFVAEDDIISSLDSFLYGTNSVIGLETVTHAEILTLKLEDYDYIRQLHPSLNGFFQEFMIQRIMNLLDEKNRMINMDATQRYLFFKERYEKMFHRLPLNQVSSYLGIRQQSLSRIRQSLKESFQE